MQASSSYDALLIADSGRVAMQVAPIVRKNGGATARLLGTELWNTDSGLASSPVLRGAWFASVSDGLYRQLATKYRARYGNAPFRLSALGYDAVLLTVRIARDWKPGTTFPAARLRNGRWKCRRSARAPSRWSHLRHGPSRNSGGRSGPAADSCLRRSTLLGRVRA